MGLGSLAQIGAPEAREMAAQLRKGLVLGQHPLQERREERRQKREAQRANGTKFKVLAEQVLSDFESSQRHPATIRSWRQVLETYAYPALANMAVSEIADDETSPSSPAPPSDKSAGASAPSRSCNGTGRANMPATEAAEFAPIRAELARLYIRHAADMALDLSDNEIIARTSEITSLLIVLTMQATKRGDQVWLDRHTSFRSACARLLDDQRAVALDG
jgi:hypothetical protein